MRDHRFGCSWPFGTSATEGLPDTITVDGESYCAADGVSRPGLLCDVIQGSRQVVCRSSRSRGPLREASQSKLSGGVVVPGGVGADIGADAAEGAVAGLVGDGVVGGAAGVGVGDEPGAEAVR